MPEFYGDPRKYASFIGLFNARIDSQTMATILKLTGLVSKLKGDAEKLVAGIELIDAKLM